VAGLDAGHAYNEFPLMGGQLVPAEYWALPGWRNFFENTAAVQFDHRLLATTTLVSVAATWLAYRAAPLPVSSKRLLHALMVVTAAQVGPDAV
jgi:cytochrome c oxidase assembly protein subunit 15